MGADGVGRLGLSSEKLAGRLTGSEGERLAADYLVQQLEACSPASVKIAALLDKPARRRVPLDISYLGFDVPDKFVIGCGLDYAEEYRNLPEICYLEAADDVG